MNFYVNRGYHEVFPFPSNIILFSSSFLGSDLRYREESPIHESNEHKIKATIRRISHEWHYEGMER